MKFFKSFYYALEGIVYSIKTGLNLRVQFVAAVAVTVSGFAFKITGTEWIALVICMAFVFSLELINTAIEQLCDAITTDINPRIKIIKDAAAGAVLLAAIASGVVAIIIFLPKIV
jgi:undecaprenol kinase/diacylglycerol kinase (ATP)